MIFGNFLKKTPKMFGGNYETAYICNIFSCRDDNAYSLVKSSLVFVLVAGSLKREVFRLFLFFRLKLAVSTALLRSSSSLILHLHPPPTVRALQMASSRDHTDAGRVSAPASGGTQGVPTPSDSFQQPSKHTPKPPGCRSTSQCYRDACVLCLTRGVLDQTVPGAQEPTQRPLGACCGFLSTHSPSHHSACTCSLATAPGSRRCSGAVLWTPALTATLRFSSSLCLSRPPGRHWLGAICSWNGLPPPPPPPLA